MEDYSNWRGKTVLDRDGNKIGSLGEIYVDDRSGEPAFATVKTGLFGTKQSFIPLSIAQVPEDDKDAIRVDAPADQVKNAPQIDVDELLNPEEERTLYDYYEQDWGDDDTDDTDRTADRDTDDTDRATDRDDEDKDAATKSAAADRDRDTDDDDDTVAAGAVGHDTSGPTTDQAMTRSEEELRVGAERRETGRVRLKKYVVTEHVTTTVPVQREEVRLEREPVTDDNVDAATNGPDLSDEEHEIVLNEEVPVVDKKVVPKERVRLDKETVVDEQRVEGDVRKEQIDVAGDGDDDKRR
ncbi:MAG TPA: PRC and DUF2382 domain-containing protein [Candidatus Saccharimonadales bacterium]|nr:PRC and DUF2382 domain-containing protein [Candidatus Saccharimonadales bacterium]